jgi:hypothetical protein
MLTLGLLILAQAMPAVNEGSNREVREPPSGPRLCSGVQVTSPQVQETQLRGYSASQILDLRFRTTLGRPLDGQHALELRVYTPKGHLYQVLTVPLTGPIRRAPAPRPRERSADRPRTDPEPEAAIDEPDWKLTFDTILPVGGTSIVTNSLYGSWTVIPHLDGSLKPCGPARQFRIEQ